MTVTSVRPRPGRPSPHRAEGYVLVLSLIFLVLMTLLGVSLFRGTGLLNRIAAHARDKAQSFEAAQASLQYAEWWLATSGGGASGQCVGLQTVSSGSGIQVCQNDLATASTLPWSNGFAFAAPNLYVDANGGVAGANGADVNYQALPGFYVTRMGLTADGKAQLFQVTAYGYGGNANTATVVRSTYQVTSGFRSLDGL
jgi:type IV pilus assembly protein PilX